MPVSQRLPVPRGSPGRPARDGRNSGKSVLADRASLGDDRGMGNTRTPRQIAILAYPGVQSLDVTGPLEVFAGAQQLIEGRARGERPYDVPIVARRRAPLLTSSGLAIRSEEHTSELQSLRHLVCRLL